MQRIFSGPITEIKPQLQAVNSNMSIRGKGLRPRLEDGYHGRSMSTLQSHGTMTFIRSRKRDLREEYCEMEGMMKKSLQ